MKIRDFFRKLINAPLIQIALKERKKNLFLFLSVFFSNIFAALLEGLSFALIMFSIQMIRKGDKVFTRDLPIFGELSLTTYQIVLILILGAIFLQCLRSALTYLGQVSSVFLSTKIQKVVQKKIYKQILRFNFPSVSNYKVGDLVEYTTAPALIIPAFINACNLVLVAFFNAITLLGILFYISFKLTLVVLVSIGILAIMQRYIFGKVTSISKKFADDRVSFGKDIIQNLYALRLIHTYHAFKNTYQKTRNAIETLAKVARKENLYTNITTPLNEIMSVSLLGVCVLLGPSFLPENTISTMIYFITITYRFSTRLQLMNTNLIAAAVSTGTIMRINRILKKEDKEFLPFDGKPLPSFDKEICFKNVYLKYGKKLEPAIKNVSVSIQKGKTIAFVGPSGAGKSSLLDLLLRLYNKSSGEIFIDGKNIYQYEMAAWRNLFAVVAQDNFIFNESVEENIKFGNREATQAEVFKAAQYAGAYDFIFSLPKGFKTILGERGYKLSGGERQRVALARALLKKSEILILDEATSNLDSYSEHLIQKAIEGFQGDKTIIIVAHRLSTVKKADRIYFVEGGEILEQGTHRELLQKNGKYAFYWNLQSLGEIEKTLI